MKYGICPLSMIPIRLDASDASEMVSQLLFGEVFTILEEKKNWIRIRCALDSYEGWIGSKQLEIIGAREFKRFQTDCSYCLDLVQGAMCSTHYIPITLGCSLPGYDGMNFELGGQKFTYSGQVITPSEAKISSERLIKIARKYLYAPYLWGGRSPFGIDCSGFVQVVYKLLGIPMKRDAYQQATLGKTIKSIRKAKEGDLAYFHNEKGKIIHVGIIMQDKKIIHASGQVRIDKITKRGILNLDTNKYTHELRCIKRILPEG